MIWYFRESLQLLVRVEIEQRSRELNSFKELIKKAINAEIKAAFWPRSYACQSDQHCFQGNQPSAAKASTQSKPIKDLRVEEPKSKPQELKTPASHHFNNAETSKKTWKENKKKKNDWKHQ